MRRLGERKHVDDIAGPPVGVQVTEHGPMMLDLVRRWGFHQRGDGGHQKSNHQPTAERRMEPTPFPPHPLGAGRDGEQQAGNQVEDETAAKRVLMCHGRGQGEDDGAKDQRREYRRVRHNARSPSSATIRNAAGLGIAAMWDR